MSKIKILLNGFSIEEAHANYIKTTGNYNFFPTLTITGSPACINSAISIACYSKPNREVLIASKFVWSRTQSSRSETLQIASNYYQCSPKDRYFYIECIISPVEEGFDGECKVIYGPLGLDTETETEFQLAKKEDRYRINAEGYFESAKNKVSMVELRSNILKALDHNLNKIGEVAIEPKTLVVSSQNDPKNIKVFNLGEPEISIQASTVLQRDVLMLLLEHKKNKSNELTNILPMSFTENFDGSQARSKWPHFKEQSDDIAMKKSSNVFSSIAGRDPYRKVFTDNLNSVPSRKDMNWPSVKESAFNLKDSRNDMANQVNQDPFSGLDDHIRLHRSTDSFVSGNLGNEANNQAKNISFNPLQQKINLNQESDELKAKHKSVMQSFEASPLANQSNPRLNRQVERSLTDAPMKSGQNITQSNIGDRQSKKSQAVSRMIKETKLDSVMKQYLDKFDENPKERASQISAKNDVRRVETATFESQDRRVTPNFKHSKTVNPLQNPTTAVEPNPTTAQPPNFFDNTFPKAKSEIGDGKASVISFQQNKDQASFVKAKTIRDKFNNLDTIKTEGDIDKSPLGVSNAKPEDIYSKLDEAFYADYIKMREAYESEKSKLQNQNAQLKTYNKSLLREVEFLQSERVRIESEAEVELNDKELQLLEEQTRLREKMKEMKRFNEYIEAEFSQKNQLYEETSSKLFELENSNFELKYSNKQKDDTIERIGEENLILQKKIEYFETEMAKLQDELMSAEERIRRNNMSLLQLEITQKTCRELKEEKELLKSLIDDQRNEAEKNELLIQNLYQNLDGKANEIERLNEGLMELKEKMLAKDREIEIKLKINNDQKVRNTLQGQIDELMRRCDEFERENGQLRQSNDLIEDENYRLRQHVQELRDQLNNQVEFGRLVEHEKDKIINEESDSLKKEIRRLIDENRSQQKDLEHFQKEAERLRRAKEDLEFTNESNFTKINALQNQIKDLLKVNPRSNANGNKDSQNTGPTSPTIRDNRSEPSNLEEANKKLRLKVATLISELHNERKKRKEAEGLDPDAVSQSLHSRTYRADPLNESRNINEKLKQLQRDYVEMIKENEKLRNDVYHLREEKMTMIEKFGQRKSVSGDMLGQEELVQLLNTKDDDNRNGKGMPDFQRLQSGFEAIPDFNKKSQRTNKDHFHDDEDKDKIIQNLEAKVSELQNKLLDSHFGVDQNGDEFDQKDNFAKTKPFFGKSIGKQADDSAEIAKAKSILAELLARYNEKPLDKFKGLTFDQLLEELKSAMGEVDHLKVEFLHNNKYVEEANILIAKYELQKKELASRIEDLEEEKEMLLENFNR